MTRKVLKREVVELILGDSLPYELNMLEQMFIRLHVHQPDQWVANALIEPFCIHAHSLPVLRKQGPRESQAVHGRLLRGAVPDL